MMLITGSLSGQQKHFSAPSHDFFALICFAFEKLSVYLQRKTLDMETHKQFQVVYMAEAREFMKSLPPLARKKIYYNVIKVENGVMDSELFKKLDGHGDFWELRTLFDGIQYRLLAFWDAGQKRMVVATHGFIKKTWKVPAKEIARAEALRKKYYETR